jgi:hypothetical protein
LEELTPEQRTCFLWAQEPYLQGPHLQACGVVVTEAGGEDLNPERRAFVEQLCRLCPPAEKMRQMARELREVVGERQPEALDRWLDAAKRGEVAELEGGFAQGLSKDYKAVSRRR